MIGRRWLGVGLSLLLAGCGMLGTGGGDGGCPPVGDPGGTLCDTGGDCEVECLCQSGAIVSGQCDTGDGTCASAADACDFACQNAGLGPYTGEFCAP